jgi:signal transduction histidine kinase
VRRAVGRFLVGSVVALLVLILGIVVVGKSVARGQALRDAEDKAQRISQMLGGLVTDDLRSGRAGAGEPLDRMLRSRFEDGYLAHARVWDADGTILWADDKALVGRSYPLADEEGALLGTTQVHARVSKSDHAPVSEPGGDVLEVYAGTLDADGRPLLFEAYVSSGHMKETERAIIGGFLPVGIGGLLLFQAAVLPLAVSLGRRVQRSDAVRERLTRQMLQASELERKRIAQELHDGVVQDLAGVGFSLPAIRRALLAAPGNERTVQTVDQVEAAVHRDVAALRSMMIDVYPPDLERAGLVDAVEDLAAAGRARGLAVTVHGLGDLALPGDLARVAYRVAREGLHNVAKHAHARTATVTLERRPHSVIVRVRDDGVGLRPAGGRPAEDSLGLRLLTEAVLEAGGLLSLTNGGGGHSSPGAVLDVVLPVSQAADQAASSQGSSKGLRSWLSQQFSRPPARGVADEGGRWST